MLKIFPARRDLFLLLFISIPLLAFNGEEPERSPKDYPQNPEDLRRFWQGQGSLEEKAKMQFSDGTTPLMLAAKWGLTNLVQELLDNGADLMQPLGTSALRSRLKRGKVASDGHVRVVNRKKGERVPGLRIKTKRRKSMPDESEAIDPSKEVSGPLALHYAALYDHAETIKILLSMESSKQIMAKDDWGNNPLHLAIRNRSKQAFLALMAGPGHGGEVEELYNSALKKAMISQNNEYINPLHAVILTVRDHGESFFEQIERDREVKFAKSMLQIMIEKEADIDCDIGQKKKQSLYELAEAKEIAEISALLVANRAYVKNPPPHVVKLQKHIAKPQTKVINFLIRDENIKDLTLDQIIQVYFDRQKPKKKRKSFFGLIKS